ncbi:PREDICTED: uncharacterized protein LOC108780658 [Cyphomyrmex costatus]|uniref:uncharacterized protein LOC108780658 n=1 Tax=Cyphomyrmex costatus TaxID=456900 RepID=UPI0008523D06|nr:PREDICTED: uncharacterized protein LOC108780658 [Cyphomyrmex costatus]
MKNRTEYLVKYSVAPPPSRDYYGLKIFEDEVILYLWKISHGPHKAPIVYRAKLIRFDQEKSLQNEIRRGFGKYLLKHVKNIAEGNRNTLLTLPNSVIGEISKYLEFTDVLKLSLLSHIAYEVFNTDLVWQILYTRDKKANLEEKKKVIICGWKQLYKDKEMQALIKNQKNHQISSLITNHAKTNKLLIKPISDAPKSISYKTSTTKKCSESSKTELVTTPLSKTISDIQFRTYTKNEKPFLQNKDIKNTNSTFNINDKNVKTDPITSKTITKQAIRSVSKRNEISDKQINQTIKSEKCSNKINTKSTTSVQEKNIKSSSVPKQNLRNKTQLQTKGKPKKKVIATKSEIFNNDELSENPFIIKDDKIDLADLIEASSKNIQSPRSIFDYDFSCVEQSNRLNRTKDILGIRNEIQNIDKSKQLKSTKSSVITNNFSHKIIRGDGIMEKLWEKSETFSKTSNDSLINDKKLLSGGDDKSFSLSEKYMKAREELQKSLDWNRSDSASSQNRWDPNINFQNKSFISSTKVDNNEKIPIPERSLKTSFLKPYSLSDLEKEIKF